MSQNHKVSVIVPIYGVEKYLAKCIESILAQSYKNLEVILINDGSKDNSKNIINAFKSKDERIVSLNKLNGGLVSARKAGVELASGKYLTFVDGDDWIEVDHIKNFLEIELTDVDMVVCGFKRDFLGKTKKFKTNFDEGYYDADSLKKLVLPNAIHDDLTGEHGISTYVWNKLFLTQNVRKFIKKIDNQIVMGEDSCLTYPYLFNSKKIYISNNTTYVYRQRASSIIKSVKDNDDEFNRLSLVFSYLLSALRNYEPGLRTQHQIERYFLSLMCVRSGGVFSIGGSRFFLPFSNFELKVDNKLVIFSSGSFGQHLYSALRGLPKTNIVSWIDEDYIESRQEKLEVSAPNEIKFLKFDKVLIASLNKSRTLEIIQLLSRYGISSSQICMVDIDHAHYKKTLEMIGFDLKSYNYKNK